MSLGKSIANQMRVNDMIDNRSERVKEICKANVNYGCTKVCPLAKACDCKVGDTKEIFDIRMNKAAEELDEKEGIE